ncbi:MAG TPA: efflux RND transporter periplasmic adaptor subunit [Candidatus Methanoperedens sp.]|nr:efflux RND transporter periplasmic adaptor subunit [Candidatus Methanoperedens sp.]
MNFFSKYKNKLIIGIVILIVLFFSVSRIQAQKYKNPEVLNPQKDTVVNVETKAIKSELILAGSVSASEIASLRFQNSGKLVWVGVKVGDRVKKYQAIASLDKEQLRKSLQTQFNNYRSNLSQFWDKQDEYKDTVISDTVQRILDRTQYSLDNTVISYEIADMAIKESTLYSPIAGVVTDVEQPLTGTNITPATATFTIINPESIYFKSEIDQEEVTKIKVGQSATIRVDAFPDVSFESEITYISFTPVAGQTSTVYEIRFKLPVDNQNLSYRLGMDGDAQITINQQDNALVIPLDSLNDDNGKSYVWVKAEKGLIKTYVTTGIENDTEVQILEGLNSNDSVVIKKI